ncbi:pilus assembly protein PilA [Paenibacillus thiaminolyticus]|uniref:PsbP-related protein n=1 Tax=Paenibacillus thiaminolyticus TaxID=49283 RepID=UPI0035A6B0B8
MKWQWHKIAMAVVIGSVLVTGCGSGSQSSSDSKQEGAESTTAQQTAEKSKPKGTAFTSLDGTMQLTLPSTWRQNDELNNMAQFAAYHRSNNRFAFVSRTLKADLEEGATVDDIVDRTISNADAITLDDVEVIETRDTSVGSDAAKQLEFRGIDKNGTKKKVRYLVTTVEKGDYFYQIVFWTKESKFDKYKEEFEQATQTFKVLKASDSEAAVKALAKPKVFKSADSRMELTLTTNWMEYPLNEEAEISAFYPAESEFVIVIPEAREEMVSDIQTLEDYYDLLNEYNYSEFAPGGPVEEPKSVTINGLPALQFEIQIVSEDKEKIAMLITLIESPEQFTQVVFWTTQSKIEQKREHFIEAVASYKEHDS